MVKEIPLSAFGLETLPEAAARRGWSPESVRSWIRQGLISVVIVGAGKSAKFLLRSSDVNIFKPPGNGRRGRPKSKS